MFYAIRLYTGPLRVLKYNVAWSSWCAVAHLRVILVRASITINARLEFIRLLGPLPFPYCGIVRSYSPLCTTTNACDETMTDTADDKIPLPRFSGRDDDYVEWKMQFAAYMRQKGININERGQDGTLRDGRSALDATKKAKLADRLTMALGKNAIIYRSHVDDGGAMLLAIEARYQQNSALAQTRIERKLLSTRLADPSECDSFIPRSKRCSCSLSTLV